MYVSSIFTFSQGNGKAPTGVKQAPEPMDEPSVPPRNRIQRISASEPATLSCCHGRCSARLCCSVVFCSFIRQAKQPSEI